MTRLDRDASRPQPLDVETGDTVAHEWHGRGEAQKVRNPGESTASAEIYFPDGGFKMAISLRSARLHKVDADAPPDAGDLDDVHRGQVRIAYRLANRCRDQLLHVHGIGWHAWDGRRWALDDQGAAKRAVLDVLRRALTDSLDDQELRKDVRRCESDAGVQGVLGLAAALDPFAVTVRDLDVDPYLLNVANGTLDLRTLELRPHDPADRITKVTRAAYDPEAAGPAWLKFLERVLPDADVRGFVQRLAGVGLLGKVTEHVLAIFKGTGANGKGTAYKAICWALGDFASIADPDLFLHRDGAHPTGEMSLRGVRWVVTSENDQGRRLAESTMKRLTGGDPITARHMRKDFVTFEPSHTAVLVTNHLPTVSGDDPAIWRRLRVVPFDVVIPKPEQDGHLDEALQLDADAILTWAVDGWAEYDDGGLDEPDAVIAATGRYRLDSDAVGRFVEECCFTSPHAHTPAGDLWERWCRWARDDGADIGNIKAFGQTLEQRGFPADKGAQGRRLRRGLGLYADDGKDLG